MKKKLNVIILIVLIISVPLILYLSSFKITAFNHSFYSAEFKKYNIYTQFPNADSINSRLLYYLRYGKTGEIIDIDIFTEKEKEHLVDVRILVQKCLTFLNILLVLSVGLIITLFKFNRKVFRSNMSKILVFGGFLTFFDALIFYIIVKLNFDYIFNLFHTIFFKAGTWLFSSDQNLVMIYQENFFFDILSRIILSTFGMALILMIIGVYIDRSWIERYLNLKNKH
ncbi:MAG: DUF1461 domain-containing protein [Nanoarchaeota archaeon]